MMVDYRRFDHIGEDDEDGEEDKEGAGRASQQGLYHPVNLNLLKDGPQPMVSTTVGTTQFPEAPTKMTQKTSEGRYKFEYEGRTIYEWEQSLNDVLIYIPAPPGVPLSKKTLEISITPNHITVGLKGAPPYLDEDTGSTLKAKESTWYVEDGFIVLNLQKMNKAEIWECALKGRTLAGSTESPPSSGIDPYTKEEVKKKLLLERFQEEHPGFDFSGAEFNGTVPEARDFMGGVKHF